MEVLNNIQIVDFQDTPLNDIWLPQNSILKIMWIDFELTCKSAFARKMSEKVT